MTDSDKLIFMGNQIRNRMKECGLTELDLSKRTGIHYQLIGKYIRGVVNPGFLNLDRLLRELDMSMGDLQMR